MKFFSTFSGVGGFELGIGKEHECVGFSEIDKYASSVLKYRFPKVTNYGDIHSIDAGTLPDFDLLTGGFPCQSFSVAGKRKGFEDTRGTLFFEMARIAKAKKPKYWLAENVKGLVSHDGGNTFKTILATMQELGYTASIEIINAKFYSVPQNRERLFIAGWYLPKVCLEALNDGQPTRTTDFVKITRGFLCQHLLNSSDEVKRLQDHASKDLVCGLLVLNAIIEAGQKQNWQFSNATARSLYENLSDCSPIVGNPQFTNTLARLAEKLGIRVGISTAKDEKLSLLAEEKVWESIALLSSNEPDDLSSDPSKSTTSTLIRQTTTKETFTFAETLRIIVAFTLHLRNLSNPLWNEVLSDLIILKVGTSYEPITSQTEEGIVGRSGFIRRANLSATQRERLIIECGTRNGSPREVFFERRADEKSLIEITQNAPDAERVYDPDGIGRTLKGLGGGEGAKTMLIRCPLRYLNRNQKEIAGDYASTVDASQTSGVAQIWNGVNNPSRGYEPRKDGLAPSLRAGESGTKNFCTDGQIVRRLTPTECERLMSWPDDWTKYGIIDGEKVEMSDTQRYKMCGNGVVSKVVESVFKNLILLE